MPELPDVAIFKRYLDSTALHKKIASVDVRDNQILAGISAAKLDSRLSGKEFSSTSRRGKYLFVHLKEGVLVMHFGMTGDLHYYKDPDGEPEFTQAVFTFENGYHLAFVMPRKLGELRLIKDVDKFVQAKELGPDVLSDEFDFDAFCERLSGRRGMIKTRLMDQQIMAGVGNVYSDEILFQARVHPKSPVQEMDEETLHKIFNKMKSVLETAIDRDAEPEAFPDDFLIPQRHEGGKCPGCGGEVKRVDISGRSAYYCPACQKRA